MRPCFRRNTVFLLLLVSLSCRQTDKIHPAGKDSLREQSPAAGYDIDVPKSGTTRNKPLPDCERAKEKAAADEQKDSLRYYYFSIVAPEAKTLDAIRKACKLHVVVMGCSVIPELGCYNEKADQLLEEKYGRSFNEILQGLTPDEIEKQ